MSSNRRETTLKKKKNICPTCNVDDFGIGPVVLAHNVQQFSSESLTLEGWKDQHLADAGTHVLGVGVVLKATNLMFKNDRCTWTKKGLHYYITKRLYFLRVNFQLYKVELGLSQCQVLFGVDCNCTVSLEQSLLLTRNFITGNLDLNNTIGRTVSYYNGPTNLTSHIKE